MSNPSAFPQHGWSSDPATLARMQANGGMTLRDYFAAKALQGLLAESGGGFSNHKSWLKEVAKESFELADAMLAARCDQVEEQD